MTFLITNDDGITAKGLEVLAEAAAKFGDVYVVAPDSQCSAMSHRILIEKPMVLKKVDFPVAVKGAYSLAGTPADCVKVALDGLLPNKPDFVFSGMNFGLNCAYDIAYSGTVGAAMEGLMGGVKSAAFSNDAEENRQVAIHYLPEIIREIIESPLEENAMWNVNFPACDLTECKGIERGVRIAPMQIYEDHYVIEEDSEGNKTYRLHGKHVDKNLVPKDSDIHAIWEKKIAFGKIYSNLF